jgi:hypothetical protein
MTKHTTISKALMLLVLLLVSLDLARFLWTANSPAVQAQNTALPVYIEPGVTMLRSPDGRRQVLGKMVIDLRNGNLWGFPTLTQQPFPVDITQSKPPTSTPFRLGRFDFTAMDQPNH